VNDYVTGGYSALAGILLLYVVHMRRRARLLATALAPPARRASPTAASIGPDPASIGPDPTSPKGNRTAGAPERPSGERT
jgi:hypothetical protein